MNAEEFINHIKSNADLEKSFEEAIDAGTLADFLKANGCTASADEVAAYVANNS